MIFISHRGNLNGKTEDENKPSYILDAIDKGFDVEIDVWFVNNELFLGHDIPQYKIDHSFLQNTNLWCHAKNYDALSYMLKNNDIHCFWHENDRFAITSKGFIWQYPDSNTYNDSIFLLPENYPNIHIQNNVLGICSDFILDFKLKWS